MIGIRVTPLVNNPGKLLVTNDYIYFQPFNNISINPVNKYKLESIVRMMKRSYVLRQVGMELFFDNDQSVFFAFKK
jgi:factor associated with neutral sphingomyelinase activation